MAKKVKKSKNYYIIFGMMCACFAWLLIMTFSIYKYIEKSTFHKPEFDVNAVVGTPLVDEKLGYEPIEVEGLYSIALCGNIIQEDKNLKVYFTSYEQNKVYVKIRIYEENEIIGESGLLKPGQYVENILINKKVTAGTKIMLKVMGYDSKNYYSVGSVEFNTTIK